MGPAVLERYMAFNVDLASPSDSGSHGLRFLNEDWNGSIANGQQLTLRWNESIDGEGAGLKLFRVRYPRDGEISFELVSNLTESMDDMQCYWTPENLIEDNLYALWVTRIDGDEPQWALSPPWKLAERSSNGLHWENSIGIPIIVILSVYFLSLGTCLMHRRRKRIRREKELRRKQAAANVAPTISPDADRHPSVSSVVSVQTLSEDDELVKKTEDQTWIVTNPLPRGHNRGVEWNRMVWRDDACAGYGPGPIIRHDEHNWGGGWDEGPIGQAR